LNYCETSTKYNQIFHSVPMLRVVGFYDKINIVFALSCIISRINTPSKELCLTGSDLENFRSQYDIYNPTGRCKELVEMPNSHIILKKTNNCISFIAHYFSCVAHHLSSSEKHPCSCCGSHEEKTTLAPNWVRDIWIIQTQQDSTTSCLSAKTQTTIKHFKSNSEENPCARKGCFYNEAEIQSWLNGFLKP